MLTDELELLIARHLDGETTEAENQRLSELQNSDPEFQEAFLRAQAERVKFGEIRAASSRHRPALGDIDEAMKSLAHRATSEAQYLRSLEGADGREESRGHFMPRLKRFAQGLLNPIPNLSGALAGALVIGLVLQVSPSLVVSVHDPVALPGSGELDEEDVDFGPIRGIGHVDPDTTIRDFSGQAEYRREGLPNDYDELGGHSPSSEELQKLDAALDQIDVAMAKSDYAEASRFAIELDEKFPLLADHCSCPSYRLNTSLAALYKWSGDPQEAGWALVRAGACLSSELGSAINACARTGQ